MDSPIFSKATAPGLVDRTVGTLRSRIVEGVYAPNTELPPQAELCEELGVSRGVIREAMQRLQSQQLIHVGQGRKPRVLPAGAGALTDSLQMFVDRTEVNWDHLAEFRRTLEVDIAGLAAQRGDAACWRALEKTLGAMLATDVISEQVTADVHFHRLLAQATGNPLYVFVLDALASLMRASRERTIGIGGVEPAIRGHTKILEAMRRQDSAAARKAMAAHLEEMWSDLQSV